MVANKFWNETCVFCGKPPEPYKHFPQVCECEGAQALQEEHMEEYRASPDYEEPVTPEEYEKKYPVVYAGERLVFVSDIDTHKLKLQARQFDGGVGLCVWVPFTYEGDDGDVNEGTGLCWDFTDSDAAALHELLGEYLSEKK